MNTIELTEEDKITNWILSKGYSISGVTMPSGKVIITMGHPYKSQGSSVRGETRLDALRALAKITDYPGDKS